MAEKINTEELIGTLEQLVALGAEPCPLLLGGKAAAELLGLSRREFDRLRHGGRLPAPVFLSPGGMARWCRRELIDWSAAGRPDGVAWTRTRDEAERARRRAEAKARR